jgi:ParB-like chromosome segregation protein Spo0J
MTRVNVSVLSQEHLVERFVAIAVEQDYINRMDEPVSEYNRLYDLMEEVEGELKSRPGDGRHALVPLLDDDNAHVRLKAAIATLALAPEAARTTLQALSDRNRPPEAASAREMMEALDDGSYVPS